MLRVKVKKKSSFQAVVENPRVRKLFHDYFQMRRRQTGGSEV